jgi:hypothetical protein
MSFVTDSFNGTLSQELSAYSAAWSKQFGHSDNGIIGNVTATYATTGASAAYVVYQNSASPASADYSTFTDLKYTGAGAPDPQYGPCGRMQSGASTFYAVIFRPGNSTIRLYKFVAGAATQLGSTYSMTPTVNQIYNVELRMAGTAIDVYLDGASIITSTDSAISTAGKAGIIMYAMRQTGTDDRGRIEEFWANDAGGAAATSLVYFQPAIAPLLVR